MSITKILADKDASAEDKLTAVAEVVAKARDNYGNVDATIASPMVNTPHGSMNFNHLEADSKVALLKDRVQCVKASAVECGEQTEGTNMNKEIERLLATDPYFANISAGTKFEYI